MQTVPFQEQQFEWQWVSKRKSILTHSLHGRQICLWQSAKLYASWRNLLYCISIVFVNFPSLRFPRKDLNSSVTIKIKEKKSKNIETKLKRLDKKTNKKEQYFWHDASSHMDPIWLKRLLVQPQRHFFYRPLVLRGNEKWSEYINRLLLYSSWILQYW